MANMKTATESIVPISIEQRMFEHAFRARVEDSKEYRQYKQYNPYEQDRFKYSYQMDHMDVVPMKAIHLPDEYFDKLIRQQRYLEDLERDAAYGKKIVTMLHQDECVRDDNPAVAKAYRNYLALLELARK